MRHSQVGGVSLAILAMVIMATAGSFGASTIVRPVSGPQVLSVLALSSHQAVAACSGPEKDRPSKLGTIRHDHPEMIWLASRRVGLHHLNLPPPCA